MTIINKNTEKTSEKLYEDFPDSTEISKDYLGPYTYYQFKKGFRLTFDSIELIDFCLSHIDSDKPIIDIGTGAGAMCFLLAWKSEMSDITGCEIMERECELFKKNIENNNLETRVKAINSDYRHLKDHFKEGSFTYLLSNPPFIKKGAGRVSPHPSRAAARYEVHGEMADLIETAKYLVSKDGIMFFMYPNERFDEFEALIKEKGLKLKEVKKYHHIFMASVQT